MKEVSSTLNAIHKEIKKDVERQYNHRDKNIVIKNFMFRQEDADDRNKRETGMFFEIESIESSVHCYCIVTYHIIEIADKKDQLSMIRMMNNMDTMQYNINENEGNQLLARSSSRLCVVPYSSPYSREIPDNEVKEIEVNYVDRNTIDAKEELLL